MIDPNLVLVIGTLALDAADAVARRNGLAALPDDDRRHLLEEWQQRAREIYAQGAADIRQIIAERQVDDGR